MCGFLKNYRRLDNTAANATQTIYRSPNRAHRCSLLVGGLTSVLAHQRNEGAMAFAIDQRVRIKWPINFREAGAGEVIDIDIPAAETGVIIDLGDERDHFIVVRMDRNFTCLAEWDNTVTFDVDIRGGHGVGLADAYLVTEDDDPS
jgi:hypothetical protein